MIASSIYCSDNENCLAEPIRYAVGYLKRTDLMSFAPGTYDLDRPGFKMQVIDMETDETEKNPLESHKKNIDLQFLASGEGELIGYTPDTGKYTVTKEQLEEYDIQYYDEVEDETFIPMRVGSFCVFFPWDIHRPGCILGKKCAIRKIVVKISMDLF